MCMIWILMMMIVGWLKMYLSNECLRKAGTGIKPSRLQYDFIVADIFMQLIDSELDVADQASHRTLLEENNNPTVVRLLLQFFKEIKEYDLVQT